MRPLRQREESSESTVDDAPLRTIVPRSQLLGVTTWEALAPFEPKDIGDHRHSIAWCAIADGSRPAKSQPTIAANAGMPRRMRRRSATGTLPSAAIPPLSELLRSQPIMPMYPPTTPRSAPRKPSAPAVTAVSVRRV